MLHALCGPGTDSAVNVPREERLPSQSLKTGLLTFSGEPFESVLGLFLVLTGMSLEIIQDVVRPHVPVDLVFVLKEVDAIPSQPLWIAIARHILEPSPPLLLLRGWIAGSISSLEFLPAGHTSHILSNIVPYTREHLEVLRGITTSLDSQEVFPVVSEVIGVDNLLPLPLGILQQLM